MQYMFQLLPNSLPRGRAHATKHVVHFYLKNLKKTQKILSAFVHFFCMLNLCLQWGGEKKGILNPKRGCFLLL